MGKRREHEKCRNCIYNRDIFGGKFGECRKNPPQIVEPPDNLIGAYPEVDPEDGWCGEFKEEKRGERA